MEHAAAHTNKSHEMQSQNYTRLGVMTVLSFISMYILMYAMVDKFADVYGSINQGYMAALMTAPMIIIEVVLMAGMYRNSNLNMGIIALSVIVLIGSFMMIRSQTAIGNDGFLRSMIPHHSGAILMCREAKITNPAIKTLCEGIIQSQQQEIDEMRRLLGR